MVRATSERRRERPARSDSTRCPRARGSRPAVEPLEARVVLSLAFNFTYSDPGNLLAQYPLLATDLQAAGQTLGERLNGSLPLNVTVNVATTNASNPNVIASAGPSGYYQIGTVNGLPLTEAESEYKTENNYNPNPGAADIVMNVYTTTIANYGWYDPTGVNRDAPIPQNNRFDFISVAMHELTHGLGLLGTAARDTSGNITGGYEDLYDANTTASGGYAYFVGPRAEAAYHNEAVPLYNDHTGAAGSNFSHPGNPASGPGSDLASDLMYYQASPNVRRDPSAVDLGILADIGWSVNSIKAADDFTGAKHSDVAVYVASTSTFDIAPNAGPGQINGNQGPGTWSVQFGFPGSSVAVPADYTGAGHADVATYVAGTSTFYVAPNAANGQINGNQGPGTYSITFGPANSTPVPGDYTGNGHAALAVFAPSTATWYIAPNAAPGQPFNGVGNGAFAVQYGPANSIPVPGDYTGAGHADVAVYDTNNGTWYIDPEAGAGQPNGNQGSNSYSVQWGAPGDIPVPGDYDGTGRTEIAVFRPSTATFYILPNAGPGQPFNGAGPGAYGVQFGPIGSVPTPGDYDGTGHTALGVFIPSTATWAITPNEGLGQSNGNQGPGTWLVQYGPAYSTPVEGGVPGGAPTGGFDGGEFQIGATPPGGPASVSPTPGPGLSRTPTVGPVAPARHSVGILVAIPTPSLLATITTSASRRPAGRS